jgi:hypothetical protein
MNYKEAVEKKIIGEADELERRKELWGKIDDGYERGGGNAIKSVLIEQSNSITREFDKLLKQLREKL